MEPPLIRGPLLDGARQEDDAGGQVGAAELRDADCEAELTGLLAS